jgi:hypothetical protein
MRTRIESGDRKNLSRGCSPKWGIGRLLCCIFPTRQLIIPLLLFPDKQHVPPLFPVQYGKEETGMRLQHLVIVQAFSHFFDYLWYGDCVALHSSTLVDLYLHTAPLLVAHCLYHAGVAYKNYLRERHTCNGGPHAADRRCWCGSGVTK